MPPEQVHAVGIQALNQMRDATHMPAPAGFKPQNDGLYFADGGSPAEEERKRLAGAGPSPQMGAVALGNERRAERMSGEGMYGKANADVGGALNYLNRGDPVKDAASAVGGFFARSSDQARMADYGNTGAPSPIAAKPAAAPTPPAAVGATEPPATKGRTSYGFTPDPMQGPAPGMSVRPTSAEGISRIDNAPGLNSPLFTNLPAGQAVSEMQGGGRLSSADLAGGNERMARANAIRQEYLDSFGGPKVASIGNSGVDETNARFRESRMQDSLKGMGRTRLNATVALRNADMAQQRADEELGFRAQEGEANRALTTTADARRAAVDRERLDIDRQRAEGEAQTRGFEARGLERMERFYAAYENAKTPEERAAAAEQLRVLSGKEAPNRFTVVPGGQEIDPKTNMAVTRPARVFNNQSGQFVDQQGAPGASAAPRPNHIDALKKNPNQAAQFDAIYGEGAAARYLGAN